MPFKRKLTNKSLAEKFKVFKDLENGMSNEDVAAKYGVPQNTVLTWVKSKHKLTTSLEKKGTKFSKYIHCGNYEKVDKMICNWFIDKKANKYQQIVS